MGCELSAAKIGFLKLMPLNHRPHRTVKDEDARGQQLMEQFGGVGLYQTLHILKDLKFDVRKRLDSGYVTVELLPQGRELFQHFVGRITRFIRRGALAGNSDILVSETVGKVAQMLALAVTDLN